MKLPSYRKLAVPILCIMAVCCIAGCTEPAGYEIFIRQGDTAGTGRYDFRLDMSDSLSAYDIAFFTRTDNDSLFSVPLDIRLISPSGKEYRESVYIPASGFRARSGFSAEYRGDYRTGAVPAEYGIWMLQVTIPGQDRLHGLRGLGLSVRKDKRIE